MLKLNNLYYKRFAIEAEPCLRLRYTKMIARHHQKKSQIQNRSLQIPTSVSRLPSSPLTKISVPSSNHHQPFVSLLSTCKDLKTLFQIHAQLITAGLQNTATFAAQLINLYSKFQQCRLSLRVFNSTLPNNNKTTILYNSMIRAYANANQHQQALNLYHAMLQNGVPLDKYTFTFALKACTGILDPEKGAFIHHKVIEKGLESDVFIGTALVDMYSKLGDLVNAKLLFDKMPVKDIVVYNAMLSGFSQSEEPGEALRFFRYMYFGCGIEPNCVSLLNLFPAICRLMDLKACKSIHGYMCKRDFSSVVFNGLIDMYSKCGDSDKARIVFEVMKGRDDVSWGTMMAGYAYQGRFDEVLELFERMNGEYLRMNKVSAVSALLAAGELGDLEKGVQIHECATRGKVASDVVVATSLMTMYAKCGEIEKVKELFEAIEERDLISWSAIISAFSQCGYPEEALSMFRNMQIDNLMPSMVTMVSVLPACADLLCVKEAKSLHCYAVKASIDSDVSVGTALVSMYAKCNIFSTALAVFNRIPHKEVVTWNALINGYAQIGDASSAMGMFYQLNYSGHRPDAGTMVGVLPACALLGDIKQGTRVHGQIIKHGFELDGHVKNALIDMYAKCGCVRHAEILFNEHEFTKDEVAWNVMIAGYMNNGYAKQAMSTLYRMKLEALSPSVVTIVSILPAVSYLTDLKGGMAIHAFIIQRGFQSHTIVGNCLIDMYAKSGQLDYSENIFNEMNHKDTVSWNAMLAAYSVHGHGSRAVAIFSLMQNNDIKVDSVSFISVLSACRHAGLVEEGRKIFCSMRERHHLEPNPEHYACMVDLLGRAGLLGESLDLIRGMPMQPDAAVWGSLLDACKMHSNAKLGEVALQHLVSLEEENPAHYVVLSNIYSQSGRWDEAGKTRLKMNEVGLRKTPGLSWFDTENKPT